MRDESAPPQGVAATPAAVKEGDRAAPPTTSAAAEEGDRAAPPTTSAAAEEGDSATPPTTSAAAEEGDSATPPTTSTAIPLPQTAGERQLWNGLPGASVGFLLAREAARIGQGLVVCSSNEEAHALAGELNFFAPRQRSWDCWIFPDRETLPWDLFAPDPSLTAERLRVLACLPAARDFLVVASVTTLMQRLPAPEYFAGSLVLDVGKAVAREALEQHLQEVGYARVDKVYEPGEFALRGSLLDIFPPDSRTAYRIDMLDEVVERLVVLDVRTQRSGETLPALRLLPAREFPLNAASAERFRRRWHEKFSLDPRSSPLYRDVLAGVASPGLEDYLPMLCETVGSFFDYLPAATRVFLHQGVEEAAQQFWQQIEERRVLVAGAERPLLPSEEVFLPPRECLARARDFPRVMLRRGDSRRGFRCHLEEAPSFHEATKPMHALADMVRHGKERVLLCGETAGRCESLAEMARGADLIPVLHQHWEDFLAGDQPFALAPGALRRGCRIPQQQLVVLSEEELFDVPATGRRRTTHHSIPQRSAEETLRHVQELKPGSLVVHLQEGIGRFEGLVQLEDNGIRQEFLCLLYAQESRLYLPVSSLHLLSRYVAVEGDAAEPQLDRLGGKRWREARARAAKRVCDVAAELLDIQARRQKVRGPEADCEREEYEQFCHGFPYEETPDQLETINTVWSDMHRRRPMDRLVCGDTGFGKTEVALRAAFIAVQSNMQVALLSPTTLLARQHYECFRDRFGAHPAVVELFSRLQNASQSARIRGALAEGNVDIVIGTHQLLGKNINIPRLGLLIIDEEHRFGVRQKEKFKAMRSGVHILSLSATPIPRTLNMGFSGLRDMSIIATPPQRRLEVRTLVEEFREGLVREAVMREILRGGQVFYVHNRVHSIAAAVERLRALVPQARIGMAHGQLPEDLLDRVMTDFYHKRINVLVCSAIIESGIDVPSANTIIIDRADRFGLAQLHQLRGRVGRSFHQGYAYMLIPGWDVIDRPAELRLRAIAAAHTLGSGFQLAIRDLEIRGAGRLLGVEQSGRRDEIGLSLYMRMLERAVTVLSATDGDGVEGADLPVLDAERLLRDDSCEIDLNLTICLPEQYLDDAGERLLWYRRIADAANEQALLALREELVDCCGSLPEEARRLWRMAQLRLTAQRLKITRLRAHARGASVRFAPHTPVPATALAAMLQSRPGAYRMAGEFELQLEQGFNEEEARLGWAEELLGQLHGALA